MGYLFILLFLIALLILVYKVFNKDITSPTLIYTLSMIMCTICAVVGLFSWNNVVNIKSLTVIIIILSVASFALGEWIIRKFIVKDKKRFSFKKENDIEWWKIITQIIFVIITIIVMYREVKRIAIIAGYTTGNLGTIIGYFRQLSTLYTTELLENGQGVNTIVSQMRKICEVICFVNIYFLIMNIYNGQIKNKKNIGLLTIVLLCFFLSLLTGGRMQMLIYVVAALFIVFMVLLSKYDFKELVKRYSKQFLLICILIVVGFYAVLPMSGRKNNVNIVSYMSFYFGTSIPSLDIYLDNPTESEYFGEETLRGIQTVLFKFELSDKIQPISKEWLEFKIDDDTSLFSNIFTSSKRYYHDFGIIGIILCQMIFGGVFSYIYLTLNNKSSVILLIFYSMNVYMVIDQIRDDLFYSSFVHINSILYFFILYVGYNLLTKFKIKNWVKK